MEREKAILEHEKAVLGHELHDVNSKWEEVVSDKDAEIARLRAQVGEGK